MSILDLSFGKVINNYYCMFNFFFPMFNTNLLCDVNDVLMIKYVFVLVKRGIMIIFNNYYLYSSVMNYDFVKSYFYYVLVIVRNY